MGPKPPGQRTERCRGLGTVSPPLAGSGFSSFLHLGRWPQGQSPRLNPLPVSVQAGSGGACHPSPRPGGGLACFPRVRDQHGLGSCGDCLPRFGQQDQPPALSPSLSQRLGLGLLSVEAPGGRPGREVGRGRKHAGGAGNIPSPLRGDLESQPSGRENGTLGQGQQQLH